MAKDAKGHGSDKRSGGSYPNIDRSGFRPGQHVGYGDGTFRITKLGAGYLATEQRTGESFRGDSLGHVSSQLTDRAAKAALANGHPKAADVPVHSGASGRSDFPITLIGDKGHAEAQKATIDRLTRRK